MTIFSLVMLYIPNALSDTTQLCKFDKNNQIDRHLLRHVTSTSRDHYYINLADKNDTFIYCDLVGGEHITYVNVLGFYNDRFSISTQANNEGLYTSITGKGFSQNQNENKETHIVVDNAEVTWIRIELSASFDAFVSSYRIVINKY